jgi:hypothetical protein
MPVLEKYVNPAETSYRAWCRDCNLFVSDTWDPFLAKLEADGHQVRQYRKHYIVMYTDSTDSGFTGLEGN